MSSVAKACPHCHEPLGELTESDRQQLQLRRWRDRLYRARNVTYAAMALVVVGVIAWWMAEPQGLTLPLPTVPGVLLGFGFLAYLASWGWLIWLRTQADPRGRQDRR